MPGSIGCKTDVQFGGKKCIFTLLKTNYVSIHVIKTYFQAKFFSITKLFNFQC